MNLRPEVDVESVHKECGRLLAEVSDKLFICDVMCRFLPGETQREMKRDLATMGEVKKLLEVLRRLIG